VEVTSGTIIPSLYMAVQGI